MRGQPSESQERFGGASLQPITRLLEKTQGWWIRWHEPLGTNVIRICPAIRTCRFPGRSRTCISRESALNTHFFQGEANAHEC